MLALRYAAVLALAFWVGGLAVLGALAAPAAFDVLGSYSEGRLLAGSVVGEMLRRFTLAAYLCGGVLLVSLLVRGVLGPRPRRFALRLAALVLMSVATAYVGLVLEPAIAVLQRTIGVPASTLAEGDPRRIEFGRLHGLSVSLQLVPLLGGLVLLFWELRD